MYFRKILSFLLILTLIKAEGQNIPVLNSNFDTNAAGWTFSNLNTHDWKWYADQGEGGTGGLRMKIPSTNNFFASPSVSLQAGQTYTVSFKGRMAQGSTNRKIKIAFNSSPTIAGSTNFYSAVLQPNSYVTPPFLVYSPTFTVPTSGNYNIIFSGEDNGYAFTYIDEIIIERTHFPATNITFPANDSQYTEGTNLNITANASDFDGNITKVEFFLNGLKLAEDLTAPYEYLFKDILPASYQLKTVAYDNRENKTTSSIINFKVQFSNGQIFPYVNWNFDTNLDYFTINGDWRLRGGAWHGTNCLECFNVGSGNFIASSAIQFIADETYTVEFLNDTGNNRTVKFFLNDQPELGGTEIASVNFLTTDDFLIKKTFTFTVPVSKSYHLVLTHPYPAGSGGYQQIKIDNLRIFGTGLNQAPVSKMRNPSKNITVAENSKMFLQADVKDLDGTAILKTEFYANSTKLGEDLDSAFTTNWSPIPLGTYQVYAKTYDALGAASPSLKITTTAVPSQFTTTSLLGGSGNDDAIRGSLIQKNGVIVLAANISNKSFSGITEKLLNNATNLSSGAIIRLTPDGQKILSITRIATQVADLAADSLGNLYVAAGINGLIKLSPKADSILWSKNFSKTVHRVSSGKNGYNVIFVSTNPNLDDETISESVSIYVHDKNGNLLSVGSGASQYTSDVTIDEASQTIIITGFKNFNTPGSIGTQLLPVYVPVIVGRAFDGSQKYRGYDWGSDETATNWINRSNNNMADVRAVRTTLGKDGKLYVLYEVYGGNHVLRYQPFDIMQTAPIVAGDTFFNFANTGTEVKVFIGRYDASNLTYLAGQQFVSRLPNTKGNTVFSRLGNVDADEDGRVYYTGESAFGLPIDVDYLPGEYLGGAVILVLSPNMATREICTRLTIDGNGRTIAIRNKNHWFVGGSLSTEMYQSGSLQTSINGMQDGWFAVLAKDNPCPNNLLLSGNYGGNPPIYMANSTIISSQKISNFNLVYDAAKGITLNPGFEAKTGSVFNAKINGCDF